MEEAMAGAVVGATIQVVLQSVLSFSVEQVGHILNTKNNVEMLKQSLVTIRDFLEDAETNRVTDKPVQRWLMKLEDVAFYADYVCDEFNYEVLRKKVQRGSSSSEPKIKVRSFYKTVEFGLRIKKINDELKSIHDEANGLGLQMRFAGAHARGAGAAAPASSETDSMSIDRVFVGRENDAKKIKKVIDSPIKQKVLVLPIVGMGGLGKTTLARKVFNDAGCRHNNLSPFENRIWVHVSENFVPETVFKSVLATLTRENATGNREVVLSKLQEKIGEQRYLLVLDDVWNEDAERWDNFITSLEAISTVEGNVVLVTTRKGNVASTVKTTDIHELGILSKEDCWCIIKAKAFQGDSIPSAVEAIGKNIAEKCGGLPLAAKVVGSLLRGKPEDEWRSIENKWLRDHGGDSNNVSKILKLSFDNLALPRVKKCFAYCSILPKGWLIEKEQLIHLWMAEGLLQTYHERDMESVGNMVFNILLQSSLLQAHKRDRHVKGFGMHDLMHDLASSILSSKFLDGANQVRYLSRPSIDESSPILQEHAKYLRGLFCGGKVSHIKFSEMKCLHVLILNDGEMKELPIEIGKLICLRLLDISNTKIEFLPDSIGNLYHLQTLRATKEHGCRNNLRELPDTFKFLINLRHLYIPKMKLPPQIRKLISLQTLPYFQVGDEKGCGIMELGSLKNLKGEIEIQNLEKVRHEEEARSADLFHKPNILKLKLVWNESREDDHINDEKVLEGLQPHQNLKSLEIEGFRGRSFPLWTLRMEVRERVEHRWIELDNLSEIKLLNCGACQEIPTMGHLPRLKSVYLSHVSNVKSMGSSFYGVKEEEDEADAESTNVFRALEKLVLIDMANLIEWREVSSAFRQLEYLKITECRQLKSAPSHLPCLKELEINDMKSGIPLASICGSKLTTLVKLKLCNVDEVVCLPDELFDKNQDLLELDIRGCSNLTQLVQCFGGGGASLRKLVIRNCSSFEKLPEDVDKLSALEELRIWSCPNLKSISYPSGEHVSSQGFTSLRQLEFGKCKRLTNLSCGMLESCVLSLEKLVLQSLKRLTNLPQVMSILKKMSHLTDLQIIGFPKLPNVVLEFGEKLEIGRCRDHASFKAIVDCILPAFQSLRKLELWGMEEWDALPDQLQYLRTLHELCLVEFGIQVLPDWIESLSALRGLKLWRCRKLKHLPSKKAMQGLPELRTLYISHCLLLEQELKQQGGSDDDSEWSKVSHIPYIQVDERPFSAAHQ